MLNIAYCTFKSCTLTLFVHFLMSCQQQGYLHGTNKAKQVAQLKIIRQKYIQGILKKKKIIYIHCSLTGNA